jgi:hypothetical protein
MKYCKYKDIFGKPGQGAHKIHIGNVALVDLVATFFLAWGTSFVSQYIIPSKEQIPLTYTLIFWLVMAIVVHKLFCVKTSLLKFKWN